MNEELKIKVHETRSRLRAETLIGRQWHSGVQARFFGGKSEVDHC
jgi:hypothetical protein